MFFVLVSSIFGSSIGLMSFEKSYAQRDDDDDVNNNNNHVIGQDGEGNEASQSENSSQENNQNSMCVSGEITSLSCNNLSSETIGASVPGEQGPQGPPGATGETGPAGPQGEKGDTGATGPMGPEGEEGPQGSIGPIGPIGPQGETGLTGSPGPQGEQGPQGETGLTGSPGPQGEQGPQGPEGPPFTPRIYTVVELAFNEVEDSTSEVEASCEVGDVLTGGTPEYFMINPDAKIICPQTSTLADPPNTYSVSVTTDIPLSFAEMQLRAEVICLDLTP
jgi:hypothetical protein